MPEKTIPPLSIEQIRELVADKCRNIGGIESVHIGSAIAEYIASSGIPTAPFGGDNATDQEQAEPILQDQMEWIFKMRLLLGLKVRIEVTRDEHDESIADEDAGTGDFVVVSDRKGQIEVVESISSKDSGRAFFTAILRCAFLMALTDRLSRARRNVVELPEDGAAF